jgi:hypothetical protein
VKISQAVVDKIVVVSSINDDFVLWPSKVDDWTESNKLVKLIFKITMTFWESREHLRCSHWVTNITQFLLSSLF